MNKRLMALAIILVGFLAVSAVSAADNVTEDVVGIEMTDNTDVNAADEVAIVDDIQEVELDDGKMACATDETPLASEGNLTPFQGKFSELVNEIGSGGNITLNKFYYEYDSGDTIEITTPGVIDGSGFTVIDMRNADIQVFKVSAENVTFKGITFININYSDYGGGIYFNAAHGTVDNCRFHDNNAPLGSSIFFNDDYGTVVGCTFENNAASNMGGAIYDNGEYLSLINCKFISNTAFNDGGAVCIRGRYSTICNCSFEDSSAKSGGAVYIDYGGSIIGCNFANNIAYGRGGAVNVFILNCEIDNCIFTDNFAYDEGGALYLGDTAIVGNSAFTGNNASEGGAIQFSCESNVIGCDFTDNFAAFGGAISFWSSGSVRVSNFDYNSAYFDGGAIYFDNIGGNIYNCNFTGNSASDGGAMFSGAAYDSTFIGNSAKRGGALFETYYLDCIFINNTAQYGHDSYFLSNIECSNVTAFYNAADFLVISLDYRNMPIKHVNISVDLNGVNDFITDAKGQVYVPTAGLNPGNYVAEISFPGNDNYGPASTNVSVTILKAPSKWTTSNIVTVYNTENFIVAYLKYENGTAIEGANVVLEVNRFIFNMKTDANGKVNLSTEGFSPDTYEAVFSFAGNDYIAGSWAYANVTVKKIATIWDASSISTVYNTEKVLVATLTDENGVAINGANVTVKFNGANMLLITDNKGQVRVSSAGLDPKTYTATFSFAGTEFIAGSSATAKVTVNKITSTLTASSITAVYNIGKTLVVKLKGNDGANIKGSVILKLSNGYTKTLTTDKYGQAKFSIPANWVAKSYTATIKFAGNAYYAATSKSVTVTVKKDSTKLVASNKAFTLKATKKVTAILKDSKNRIIKNRYVTFKVAGATYKVKTDSHGVATAIVKIAKKGTFATAVNFAGDNCYLKCSKAIKVTVK